MGARGGEGGKSGVASGGGGTRSWAEYTHEPET